MTRRSLVLVAALGLLMAAWARPAQAHITLAGDQPAERALFQRWINGVRAPSPNLVVDLHEGWCPFNGETSTCVSDEHGWEAWLPDIVDIPGEYGPPTLWWHLDFLQEMGHVYDFGGPHTGYRQEEYRRIFDRIFGYEEGFLAWVGGGSIWNALNRTQEKFAMYYAYCGYGMSFREVQEQIDTADKVTEGERGFAGFGVNPDGWEYREVCKLIHHLPK
jgi:hypothetical protein